jgi:hypothetical protein
MTLPSEQGYKFAADIVAHHLHRQCLLNSQVPLHGDTAALQKNQNQTGSEVAWHVEDMIAADQSPGCDSNDIRSAA